MDKQCKNELQEILRSVDVTGAIVAQTIDEINEAYISYRRRCRQATEDRLVIEQELRSKE